MFDRDAGSRGSHCILDDDGVEMHSLLVDPQTDRPYRFKPENEALRDEIVEITFNPEAGDLFDANATPLRPEPVNQMPFEPAWAEFRQGKVYDK